MRALLMILLAAPAFCCLNDREVVRSDAEFRAVYGEETFAAAQFGHRIALGALIVVLAGGAAVLAIGLRQRRLERQRASRRRSA